MAAMFHELKSFTIKTNYMVYKNCLLSHKTSILLRVTIGHLLLYYTKYRTILYKINFKLQYLSKLFLYIRNKITNTYYLKCFKNL